MYISNRFASMSRSSLNGGPLDDDELRRRAPSIFATERHESRTDRYSYIPTADVVAGMRREGFEPVMAKQGGSRIAGKAEFTKHLIRFRPAGTEPVAREIGGLYPEVVVVNSHDGTSAYKVMAGLMRLVCLNGMMVSDREIGSVTVAHKGDVVSKVIEGSYTVIEESRRAIEAAQTWAGVSLSRDDRQIMAQAAHVLRFGDPEGETDTAITPDQLLRVRRSEDRGESLWLTHNVIQENVIRGGLSAWGRDANNRQRRTTTREVKNIDGDVRLNRALWMLSEHMAALKNAA
jgi:hypothetical protein